jgi:hypothetical protein
MSTSATNGSNGTKSHASTTGVPTGSTKSSPHQKGKPQKKKGQYKQKTGKGGPMAGNEWVGEVNESFLLESKEGAPKGDWP